MIKTEQKSACRSVLQCVAVCCNVLQCAVVCSHSHHQCSWACSWAEEALICGRFLTQYVVESCCVLCAFFTASARIFSVLQLRCSAVYLYVLQRHGVLIVCVCVFVGFRVGGERF